MPSSEDDTLALPAARFVSGLTGEFLDGRNLELLSPLSYRAAGSGKELTARPGLRSLVVDDLRRANLSYGHPRAEELSARFADPSTVVIVTGQQAGLFGGPLLGLTKMIGAAKWAAQLEQRGIPAVAVFWVATEDHDFDEIARCTLRSGSGPRVLGLGRDENPLMPVGMRTLGPTLSAVLEQAGEIHDAQRAQPVWEALTSSYRPDARIGEAFCRFMVWLLGEHAPLLLDSMLPTLKEAEKPALRALVEKRQQVSEALSEAETRVVEAGHKLQVRALPDASPLFQLCGERRCRVVWKGRDEYVLRGAHECDAGARSVEELLRALEENPTVISPGVLARPVVQDVVLGSSLQLMGPGELGYMAQASALYRGLEVDAPLTTLRPQILVLPARQRRRLEKLEMSLVEALASEDEIMELLAGRSGDDFVEPVRGQILEAIEGLRERALELEPQLERPFEKTRQQLDNALGLFSKKVVAATARRQDDARRGIDSVRSTCLPMGSPQERVMATADFALTYGRQFSQAVWEQIDVDSDAIQIIDPQGAGS